MIPPLIRPVLTKRDEAAFIKFQWVPYRGDPNWVPPLLMDRRKLIDRKNNPFYKHSSLAMWLAERDGAVVGRIAAVVNENHIKEHNEKVGFFGFFECLDDREVATALFETACRWLKERGMEAVRGPANPSVNDEYGLLIEGFQYPPTVLMTYNPSYYARLIEEAGFAKVKDLYAYALDGKTVFTDRLVRGAEIVRKRTGAVIREIDMKHFDSEVKTVREVYTRGWARNWGEVPMTEEEFASLAKDLKMTLDPRLVIMAEIKGKPVGFGLALPDYNQILIKNRHGYLLPAIVRILLFKKRINFARVMVLGVLPEHMNSGIGSLLFYELGRRSVEAGYPAGEASWVLEDNVMMNRGAEMMNGVLWKKYRMYQKPLNYQQEKPPCQ
jgi:GNAT superfamily N-acetyltransferase